MQVPTEPLTLHALQAPVHAELQHTPSTQRPEAHWLAAEHVLPLQRKPEHEGRPGVPAGAAVQVPGVALHTSHGLPHAVLQQKPSMHWCEAHCAEFVQAMPLARGTPQVPPLQPEPLAQSESASQVVGQLALAPSQTKGAQLGAPGEAVGIATQVPAVQVSQG